LARKLFGGFFFFSGVLLVVGGSWGNDREGFAAGLFNLAVGVPLFWPTLKIWLNQIRLDN